MTRRRTPSPRVDVRQWLTSVRLSGFTLIMMGLVVLAVLVLVPTVSTYVGQRQQIAAMTHSVSVTEDEIAALQREREQWRDPGFITAQARSRLFYQLPGEVLYVVDDDLSPVDAPRDRDRVDKTVQAEHTDWMTQLVRSVTTAGMARTVAGGGAPAPAASPTPSPSVSPTPVTPPPGADLR